MVAFSFCIMFKLLFLSCLLHGIRGRVILNRVLNKCLDKEGRIEECTGGPEQEWEFRKDSKIINKKTFTCLDASAKYVFLQKCKAANANQTWTITSGGQIKNNNLDKCLYPENPYVSNLTPCTNYYNQIWEDSAKRRFVNRKTKKCIADVAGSVKLVNCGLSSTQFWEMLQGRIKNVQTGKCLQQTSDTLVSTGTCETANNKKSWLIDTNGALRNREFKKCLEPSGDTVAPAAKCTVMPDQSWDAKAYRIFVNKALQKCLEDAGSDIRMEECVVGKEVQSWELVIGGKLRNVKTKVCLDAGKDCKFTYTSDCYNPMYTQKQTFVITGAGQIKNDACKTCLLPKNNFIAEQGECNMDANNQKWDREKGQ